ncbi:hypothetical protein M514_28147, partial [Trichuris suis]
NFSEAFCNCSTQKTGHEDIRLFLIHTSDQDTRTTKQRSTCLRIMSPGSSCVEDVEEFEDDKNQDQHEEVVPDNST